MIGAVDFAARLARVPGVIAVTLGRLAGDRDHRPDSDWDFGLYYRGTIDPGDLRALGLAGEVFAPGDWGRLMNGGAWLRDGGDRIDVIYRDSAAVGAVTGGYVRAVPADVLAAYDRTTFTNDGKTRAAFRRGAGPAVIVMAEIPGITPKVVAFADRVVDIGCTAVLPHLFGDPGRDPLAGGRLRSTGYALSSMVPACVSREFTVLATGRTSPVVSWLRALAADEHARCGGPGVGAVGMCFTGGFALAMATDDRLLAPVLSQPSLPFGVGRRRKRSIDISAADLDVVKGRCANDGLRVLGLRFKGDRFVPAERFEFLTAELGDGFVAVELDDAAANPDAVMAPHSVLTEHLIDEPGQPTRDALDQVLELFRAKLLA